MQSIMKPNLGGLTIFLVLCLFIVQTAARYIFAMLTKVWNILVHFRMSELDETQFIDDFLTVMGVSEQDQNSLMVYNFGYDRPLPFPSIALTPNSSLRLNLQTSGIQSQSRRSIAVVGDKHVARFADIMLDIDRIHEDTQALLLAIFVHTKQEINTTSLNSYHMHETPYLVDILLLSYRSSVQILITPFRFIFLMRGPEPALCSK